MADIIHNKLGVQLGSSSITCLTFIRLFYYIFRFSAVELGLQEFYDSAIILSDLEQKMEILACDASCSSIRPSELALVAICTSMDASISKLEAGADQIHGLVDYAIQLQKLCRVSMRQQEKNDKKGRGRPEICFAIKLSQLL
jgi:cyclin G2